MKGKIAFWLKIFASHTGFLMSCFNVIQAGCYLGDKKFSKEVPDALTCHDFEALIALRKRERTFLIDLHLTLMVYIIDRFVLRLGFFFFKNIFVEALSK